MHWQLSVGWLPRLPEAEVWLNALAYVRQACIGRAADPNTQPAAAAANTPCTCYDVRFQDNIDTVELE